MAINPPKIDNDWRFECKYRLTHNQYHQVRNSILPYMKKDHYSRQAPLGRYFIRSLYFDSHDFKNYSEKIFGDCDRVKLRFRTYSNSPIRNTPIRAELKARKGITVEKHSTWIDYQDYLQFMNTSHWDHHNDLVLNEFERIILLRSQQPAIIVEYFREGYSSRDRNNIRLTFDHKVHSANTSSLFPKTFFFRDHHKGIIILEIKFTTSQPVWLRDLVQRLGLRITANSKYAQGLEAARTDIVTSTWSR